MAKNWALDFTPNQYVSIPDSPVFYILNNVTWECRVYHHTNSDYQNAMIQILDNNVINAYGIIFDVSGKVAYQIGTTTGSKAKWSTNTVSLNIWHHIECSYDNSNNVRLFIDGILEFTHYPITGDIVDVPGPLGIGYDFRNGRYFDGVIDEVRISNVVRHTANFTPPTRRYSPDANTMALYHFDNNYLDSSGNGNHGAPSDPAPTFVTPGAPLYYGLPAPMGRGLAGQQILRGVAR